MAVGWLVGEFGHGDDDGRGDNRPFRLAGARLDCGGGQAGDHHRRRGEKQNKPDGSSALFPQIVPRLGDEGG